MATATRGGYAAVFQIRSSPSSPCAVALSHRQPSHSLTASLSALPFSQVSSHSSLVSSELNGKRLVTYSRRVSRSCGRGISVRASEENGGIEKEYDYDLFTIGAGSGGVRASRFASQYGARAAICELPFSTISSDSTGGVGGT